MRRLFLVAVVAAGAASACQDAALPTRAGDPGLALDVSDAAHGDPAAHFYFLPPIVQQPAAFTGDFNPGLQSAVEICNLTDDPGCTGYVTRFEPAVIAVDPIAELYKVNWKTGDSNLDATKTYRVRVLVGATELGYRDVDPADSPNEVPNSADQLPVYAFLNGSTIPLKWRIEYGALCDPSVPADLCGEGTIDLAQGGSVQNSYGDGVTVPAQSDNSDVVTVVVQPCETPAALEVDMPLFGPCIEVNVDPPIPNPGLSIAATVSLCRPLGTGGLSEEQEDLVTLLRRDDVTGLLQALPHSPDYCPSGLAAGVRGEAQTGLLAIRDQLLALVMPKPLMASMRRRRLDLGRGGSTPFFSSFQFGLPPVIEIVPATNNQTAFAGQPVPIAPAVHVKDGNGDDVANATVHFEVLTPDGTVIPTSVVTGANGIAAVTSWTLSTTPGVNRLRGFGVGLAGPNANGPLPGVDPFTPAKEANYLDEVPVDVMTGEVIFTAVGCELGSGTPNVNGVIAPGEWDCANRLPFTANLSGGKSAPAELLWMNDGDNLYVAVRVARSSEDKVNSLGLDFDNDNDGVAEVGDDVLIVDGGQPMASQFADRFLTDKCVNKGQSGCGDDDTSVTDGTLDGSGAFTNNGTYTMYEVAHPLNSGDIGHDYSLNVGSKVGVFASLRLGSGAQGNTQVPGFRQYLEITIH